MKSVRQWCLVFTFLCTYLFACNSASEDYRKLSVEKSVLDASISATEPLPPPPMAEMAAFDLASTTEKKPEDSPQDITVTQKQIIKTAEVKIQVDKLKESKALVTKLVNSHGGYLATANESRSSGEYTATFSIRVPAAKFEALLDELLKQGIFVDHNNVSAQDVTEEFVDIQTRLKTKRALESRYLELLKQARNMEDILKLEAALQQIREEIESKEGRLKYLQNQVGYSTINLEIYEEVPYTAAPTVGFWGKLAAGFGNGWDIFLEFTIGMITLWPFWVALAAIIWLIRRWLRNRRLRKTQPA
jgi:hypothetical protein